MPRWCLSWYKWDLFPTPLILSWDLSGGQTWRWEIHHFDGTIWYNHLALDTNLWITPDSSRVSLSVWTKWGESKLGFCRRSMFLLCDSGRDNKLRVKSSPVIVIINSKKQNKPKNSKFRGDDETHPGADGCTDAWWRMPERMHMLKVETQVPICAPANDGMAKSFFLFPIGVTKIWCNFWYGRAPG